MEFLAGAILVGFFLGYDYRRKCKELDHIKSTWIEPSRNLLDFMDEHYDYPEHKEKIQAVGTQLIHDGIYALTERELIEKALNKYDYDPEALYETCKALVIYKPKYK